jgi:hypothetical protein
MPNVYWSVYEKFMTEIANLKRTFLIQVCAVMMGLIPMAGVVKS